MSVEDLRQAFLVRWQTFTRYFWPDSPRAQLEAELARLTQELQQRYLRLVRRRCRIEQLRYRLDRQRRRAAALAARMQDWLALSEGANAWETAQALERQQQRIEATRRRLLAQESAYGRQRLAFEQRKEQRARLQACRQLPRCHPRRYEPPEPLF
jgi:hypothetical protein